MIRDRIWGSRMGMVVVDPQRKFSLKCAGWEGIRDSAVAGINRYARLFRSYSLPIIFVRYDGEPHIPYEGDDGEEWLQGIEFDPGDTVFHKRNMSCFKNSDFEKLLRSMGIDCILLTGMLSEYCVASTYFSASERSITPYLGKGAHIAYDPKGKGATEIICNTVSEETLVTFFEGRQAPFEGF